MDGKNIVSQKFMNDKAIFADLFNFLYHNGERVVKSEELFPLSEISEYEITSNEIKLISNLMKPVLFFPWNKFFHYS